MRFIVDESIGNSVVADLRTAGHDVLAVADAFLQADDRDILTRAMSEKRILITNDKDFGDLIKYSDIFEAQTLTYLRLTGFKLGLVINFGEKRVKDGIRRVVNGLTDIA